MKRMKKKNLLLVAGIALVLVVAVGLTSAYVVTRSEPTVNTFEPGSVSVSVNRDANGSISLRNTGNVRARIRAQILVTWKDEKGNIYPGVPAYGTDYQMTMGNSGWKEMGLGLWRCDEAVAPGGDTPALITSYHAIEGRAPAGYALSVEVLGEAIQAEPANAGW